jgi:hypothetical protein
VRDERDDVTPHRAQRACEQRRRTDAVDVVVAVHHDRLAVAQGSRNTLDRTVELQHERGVVELVEARTQVPLGRVRPRVASSDEEPANRLGQQQLAREPGDHGRILRRGKDPPARRPGSRGRGGHTGKLRARGPPNKHRRSAADTAGARARRRVLGATYTRRFSASRSVTWIGEPDGTHMS